MGRVVGLDSLRFVLALIVVLGHGAAPSFTEEFLTRFPFLIIFAAIYNNVFVGQAAVMAFFVISGFCIHYPYAAGKKLKVQDFYIKRLWRIGIPAIVALGIYELIFNLFLGVLWSIVCEIIYYLLYPIILKYKTKYLKQILIYSIIVSYGISLICIH